MKQYSVNRVKLYTMFWREIERLGVSRQALSGYTRLPSAIFLNQADPTTDQFFAIWEALPGLSENPAVGFDFVRSAQQSALPPELFAATLAKTYGDALQRLARYKQLCAPEIITLKDNNEQSVISIEWLFTQAPMPDALVDTTFAFMIELGRANTGQSFPIKSVQLTRQRPDSDYLQQYYQCPIQFNCQQNSITFARSVLALPFSTYNDALSAMILPTLENELVTDDEGQCSEQVMWVIEQFLSSGNPTITRIARELGVGVRTLQRRISAEGNTYKGLLNQVRLKMAKNYLADSEMHLNEIAVLLGYEDQNSFYRAFKALQGDTPSGWRESQKIH